MFLISIGTATVDYIVSLPQKERGTKLTFEKGKKYYIESPLMRSGGGALNVAITAARSGVSTLLVSEWGADAAGSFLEGVVRKEHIQSRVTISRKEPTATSFIFVSPDGERTVFGSRGALSHFSLSDIPPVKTFESSWAYIVTGTWSPAVIMKLVRTLKKQHIQVALSPSGYLLGQDQKTLLPLLQLSDVVIMNRSEAALLTHINSSQPKKIFKRLDELVRGIAIMTDSTHGAVVSDGAHLFTGPAFRARVVDETGAGDAFGGGFVVGLMESGARCAKGVCDEDEMAYVLSRGAANAASVVEHKGATEGILTRKEFLTQKRWRDYRVHIEHLK